MSLYSPKKIRPLHIAAMTVRGLIKFLEIWPLLVIVAFLFSPVDPYLRYTYVYKQYGAHRQIISCTYLGLRDFIRYPVYGHCPLFIARDSRTGNRIYNLSQIL